MITRYLLYPLLVVVLLFTACQDNSNRQETPMNTSFQKEGELEFLRPDSTVITTIDIEIADTPQERAQGLMYRRSLAANHGMLFIFPQETEEGFWMKNTFIPLDIIFVSGDSSVINVAQQTRIMSEETIKPKAPKQFVVEVQAGFASRHNIGAGTFVRWQRLPTAEEPFFQALWHDLKTFVAG